MSERKIWKPQEDQLLKELFEGQRIQKWSEISKIMERHGIEGRNGKQCRERYHNHLKGGIRKEKWSPEEEAHLVQLHALHGNRWAQISKLIPGRTENCVKNMLYSKLRKAIRQLNRFSYEHYRKSLKEIKISFIYRLIDFTENSYRKEVDERNQQEMTALRLKDEILMLNLDEDATLDENGKERVRQLVEDIHTFKRVNQRFRGGHNVRSGKRGRAKKAEKQPEEVKSPASEEEFDELDYEEQGEEQKEDRADGKQEPSSAKIKQQQKDACTYTHEEPLKEVPTLQIVEGVSRGVKSKVSIMRMDSIESNLSFLMDAGLEKPIHTENQFINLTPTPRYTGVAEDWGALNSSHWRNNFVFE